MDTFSDYLNTIKNETNRSRLKEVLEWIQCNFPSLETRIAWNQPIFTEHGTFIIGFSVSKNHFAVSPEAKTIEKFSSEIEKSGYSYGSNIFRIKWTDSIDFKLLEQLIQYNIKDKVDCTTFWRK